MIVGPRFVARTNALSDLGLKATAHPFGIDVGEHIDAEPTGLTTVPGLWVAGNVTDLTAAVSGAADAGVRVAAAINADLIAEETRHAVAAHRLRISEAAERSWPRRSPNQSGTAGQDRRAGAPGATAPGARARAAR